MYTLDIISTYFPDLESISSEKLQSARQCVTDWLRPYFPDIEMSPGSTLGDLFVSPCAALIAALEEAQGRFMSDLDLENVANNRST